LPVLKSRRPSWRRESLFLRGSRNTYACVNVLD
jgi:hypothetical protein